MSLIKELLERPSSLSTASVYSAFNGVIYLAAGVLFIVWPGVTQTLSGTSEGSSALWG